MFNGSKLVYEAKKGGTVKSWNILGPFDFDVSDKVKGVTFFERNNHGDNGRKEFAVFFDKNIEVLNTIPNEGDQAVINGTESRWMFLRSPEEVTSFGTFHTFNSLGAVFTHSIISTVEDTKVRFKLIQRSCSRMVVNIDGKNVFDNETSPPLPDTEAGYTYGYYMFEADIKASGSSVSLVVAKMGRKLDLGFALIPVSHDISAHTVLPPEMTLKERQVLEDAIEDVEIEREFYYDGDDLVVITGSYSGVQYSADITGFNGNKRIPLTFGRNVICKADELPEGNFLLKINVENKSGYNVSTSYDMFKMGKTPDLPGFMNSEKRKIVYLEHLIKANEKGGHGHSDSYLIAAYYFFGRYNEITMELIRKTCDYIRNRFDCSDFRMQVVLRILYWERKERHLPDEIVDYMKETVLGFKYWQDEPGDTIMFFSTENHRLLFHTAEYLAGQLYPVEIFSNSGQNGLYHTAKARAFIFDWLRERARFGFAEFHSNSYFNITLCPLLNLLDFVHQDDGQLRFAVKQLADYMTLILSVNTFNGILATVHGRTYAHIAKHPENEGITSLMYLLFGKGYLKDNQGYASFEIATGSYQLPEIFKDMYEDSGERFWSKWQQSRYQQGMGTMNRDRDPAYFSVYRTPYVQMSAMLDSGLKGCYDRALHVAHVGLPANITVFWNTPWSFSETSGHRPNYWAGGAVIPRTFQEKNVIVLIFKGKKHNWMSHCYFERARFDKVIVDGNWIFGSVRGSYIGIYSQNYAGFTDSGPYKNRELVCPGTDNIWICECGDIQKDGSFENFVLSLKTSKTECSGDTVVYDSPSIGTIKAGWEGPVTLNGNKLELRGTKTIESNWINASFGDPHLHIDYKGQVEDIWFD